MPPHRWTYRAAPGFNPPREDCPECQAPSRCFHVGSKTVDGVVRHRYACEHGHVWFVEEKKAED